MAPARPWRIEHRILCAADRACPGVSRSAGEDGRTALRKDRNGGSCFCATANPREMRTSSQGDYSLSSDSPHWCLMEAPGKSRRIGWLIASPGRSRPHLRQGCGGHAVVVILEATPPLLPSRETAPPPASIAFDPGFSTTNPPEAKTSRRSTIAR